MSVTQSNPSVKKRIFIGPWAPSDQKFANSAITAMIYQSPQDGMYLADIRRSGERVETVTAPTLSAIKSELEVWALSV